VDADARPDCVAALDHPWLRGERTWSAAETSSTEKCVGGDFSSLPGDELDGLAFWLYLGALLALYMLGVAKVFGLALPWEIFD